MTTTGLHTNSARPGIIISDVHAYESRIRQTLNFLDARGWTLTWHDGHPILTHPTEQLIVAGDNNNRGEHPITWTYLIMSSHVHGTSVKALLGNHEQFLIDYFRTNKYPANVGMGVTADHAHQPVYARMTRFLEATLPTIPTLHHAPGLLVAHAYPYATRHLEFLYGPLTKYGHITWDKWWQTHPHDNYQRIFGHYALGRAGTQLGNNAICVDTWKHNFTHYDTLTGVHSSPLSPTADSALWHEFNTHLIHTGFTTPD